MRETLARFPRLRAELPQNYPENVKSFGITISSMRGFAEKKSASRWIHAMNLPLVIHAAQFGETTKARALCSSILKVLDDFSADCAKLDGFRKTLKPLWDNAWQDTPELWSVVGTAFLTLTYLGNGHPIVGFGRKIGEGGTDSDILLSIEHQRVHVEVDVWHATDLTGQNTAENRELLLSRARSKASRKFQRLPRGERGVVAVVCMAFGDDFDTFKSNADLAGAFELGPDFERQFAKIYWVAGLGDGTSLFLHVFDSAERATAAARQFEEGVALRHQQIAERAYYRWIDRGRPLGDDWTDWLTAERK
jgi:hypothetical protein